MRLWALTFLVIWLGLATTAAAQGRRASQGERASAEAPAGYEEAVQRALHEFELGNYAEARSVLLRAHAMYPNARTLRALGMVEYELKNYASSISYLEEALTSEERALTPEQRRSCQQLLEQANGYIGRYAFRLRPEHASLAIDGQTIRPEAQATVMLAVGDHELEVSAPAHRSLRRRLSVAGGKRETLDLVLVPLPEEPAASRAQGASPAGAQADTPVYKKWWLWTTIGVVVAAGAATGIILATRSPEPRDPNGGSLDETIRLLSWR